MGVLAASTLAEVAEILAAANADRQTVELCGGCSKGDVGRREAVDVALHMTGFSEVRNYDPPELVLMAGAGARVADIEALLTQSNQMLAFEPPDYGPLFGRRAKDTTLGGMLAANASGPRRILAGAARATISSASRACPAEAWRLRPAARWSRTSPASTCPSCWLARGARWPPSPM